MPCGADLPKYPCWDVSAIAVGQGYGDKAGMRIARIHIHGPPKMFAGNPRSCFCVLMFAFVFTAATMRT